MTERRTFELRKKPIELLVHGVPHTALATKVSTELHRRVREHCAETGVSIIRFVSEAIQERLEREAKSDNE